MVVLEVLGLQILNCSLASFGRRIYVRSYCKHVGGKQKFYGDDSCPNQFISPCGWRSWELRGKGTVSEVIHVIE